MNAIDVDPLQIATAFVVILIVATVGGVVVEAATGPEMRQYVSESAAWCEDRDGDLVNARVIGDHGGLHCELPNGTGVHMTEVVNRAE